MSDYVHVLEEIAPVCDMEDHIRFAQILTDRFVEHEVAEKILKRVRYMVASPRKMRVTGVVVQGEPGSGKSALAIEAERLHPGSSGRWPKRPVVSISMTSATQAAEIYTRILEYLKIPIPQRLKVQDLARHTRQKLVLYGVRLLVIDELNDVLNTTNHQQKETLGAIKYLMNDKKVRVFALGTSVVADAMKEDLHLAKRFKQFALHDWKEGIDCRALLDGIGERLPLRKPSYLSSEKMNKLILKLSGGCLKEMVELIDEAAMFAIVEKTEQITADYLKRAADGEIASVELVDQARLYMESNEGSWMSA